MMITTSHIQLNPDSTITTTITTTIRRLTKFLSVSHSHPLITILMLTA